MSITRLECYCPTKNGEWNNSALSITFATKTPLTLYFYIDRVVAYNYSGKLEVASGLAPRRYYAEIDGDSTEARAARIDSVTFNLTLDALIKRLFTPPHLDVDTPPGIVADWLQDRGLDEAADIVRAVDAKQQCLVRFGNLLAGQRFRFAHQKTEVNVKHCDGAFHGILPNGDVSAMASCHDDALVIPLHHKDK